MEQSPISWAARKWGRLWNWPRKRPGDYYNARPEKPRLSLSFVLQADPCHLRRKGLLSFQEIFLASPQPFLLAALKQNLKNWDNMSIIIKELDIFEGFVISWGMGWMNLTRWHRLLKRIFFLQGMGSKKTKKFKLLFSMKKGASGISGIFLAIKRFPEWVYPNGKAISIQGYHFCGPKVL
jgi:hypothetical protein